ncbi:MgtC/SapB family protein [Methanobacterium sp.]|uniref:MgtC/SapB family protein n=1 Tax=Methanobacterium sp. TaxID=2164 RepID=UPI002ABB1125|nr:MgtC/SapB family protein [Methanobacterium sp.]MDY9924110.1 MgtC/SapB family protein [Methanobacterium sp.]
MDTLLILKFLIALAIGALIGIERERKQEGAEFAGIRTFILIAIMGTISAYISQFFPYFWIVAFAGLVVLVVLSYLVTTRKNGDVGITTEVAAFLTFALGLVCFTDEGMLVAPIFAIIITTLLAVKPHLHQFAHRISEKELINTLKFLIIAFVILPLLPDEVMGPLAVFNPFQIWLMVVFISAISFTGYILMKFIGPERGLGVTGIVGGLVSSTAVATSMAARVKESGLLMKAAVFATVVASSMMFLRMLFEVSVINPSLLPQLSAPMLVMGVLGIILGVIIWKKTEVRQMDADLKLDNPFSLKPALIFGALFLGILFLSKIANIYLGSGGVYLASIISGVADVDAITISMALLAPETIPPTTAVTAITLAAISNTVFKFLIALFLGTRKFGRNIGIIFLVIIIAGLITILVL